MEAQPSISSTFSGNIFILIWNSNSLNAKPKPGPLFELFYTVIDCIAGLNLLPGSKRKSPADTGEQCEKESRPLENLTNSDHVMESKRVKQTFVDRPWESDLAMSTIDGTVDCHAEMNKHGSLGCLQTSACAVEDSLSKGFEGYLSIECCFQFDRKSRV